MTDKTNNSNTDKPAQPKMSNEQIQKMLMAQLQKQRGAAVQTMPLAAKLFNQFLQQCQKAAVYIDNFVRFVTKKEDEDRNEVLDYARRPILFGFWIILIFVGVGGLWSALAPLDSASAAIGTVIADSNKKIIQHREGGIIYKFYVKQGDEVKEGDPIVELDYTQSKTQLREVLSQYRAALASEDRLTAERDNRDEIEFNDFLLQDADQPEVKKILQTQKELFKTRIELQKGIEDTNQKRLEQITSEIEALHAGKVAYEKNLEIAEDRLEASKKLFKDGFLQKAALQEQEARYAQLQGELASTKAKIAGTEQKLNQAKQEGINQKNDFLEKLEKELKETQTAVMASRERHKNLQDVMARGTIRSPVNGIVNKINYFTVGAVVGPGQPIAEIHPKDDKLIIEAKIDPRFIDSVRPGLKSKIRFSAFKSRTTPVFEGTLVTVSRDVVEDRAPNGAIMPVYIARIEINMTEFNRVAKQRNLELHPGMQAEVQIITGERTLLQYLLAPVLDNMFNAFIEK